MTNKCAIDRRNYPPGQHGPGRQRKISQYGVQLREKQKLRRIYGVGERQFRSYFDRADRQPGVSGENFLRLLERRLDNITFRLGFAASRSSARQLVAHGNILVNDKKIDIPSFLVKPGMKVSILERHFSNPQVVDCLAKARMRQIPSWLSLDAEKPEGSLVTVPSRGEIDTQVTEQLIVEFYSK